LTVYSGPAIGALHPLASGWLAAMPAVALFRADELLGTSAYFTWCSTTRPLTLIILFCSF